MCERPSGTTTLDRSALTATETEAVRLSTRGSLVSTVLVSLGAFWLVLGLLTFWSAWFGALPRLDLPPGQTPHEKLLLKVSVAAASTLELILALLLVSFGVLFIAASRLPSGSYAR